MAGSAKRKLRVTQQEVLSNLKSGATLYKVFAVDEDGSPVEQELRSFQELPEGELVEYEISRYDSQDYGTSWTLKRAPQQTGKRVAELERRVADLESRLEQIEEQTAPAAPHETGF